MTFGNFVTSRTDAYACEQAPTSRLLGSVIVNSHFNQRNKMPYFPINQHEVDIPILTILSSKDEQLPLHASIDDFLVSHQENIPNKYYFIKYERD